MALERAAPGRAQPGTPEGEAPRKASCISLRRLRSILGGGGVAQDLRYSWQGLQPVGGERPIGKTWQICQGGGGLESLPLQGLFPLPPPLLDLGLIRPLGLRPTATHPSLRAGSLLRLQVLPQKTLAPCGPPTELLVWNKRLLWLLPQQVPWPGCNCSKHTLKSSIAVKICCTIKKRPPLPLRRPWLGKAFPGCPVSPTQSSPACSPVPLHPAPPHHVPGHPGPRPSHLPPPASPRAGLPLLSMRRLNTVKVQVLPRSQVAFGCHEA